jgi:CheY-like chemotaxis protein
MNRNCSMMRLLMAEDDLEDQMLVRKAFAQAHLVNELVIVNDGEELLDYLNRRPPFEEAHRPDLLLLDLNMPRKDGREALSEIKADPLLRAIPVVVLTTSSADEDILRSYDLGVNSYIQKPVTFPKLVELVTELGNYWFKIVKLPPNGE